MRRSFPRRVQTGSPRGGVAPRPPARRAADRPRRPVHTQPAHAPGRPLPVARLPLALPVQGPRVGGGHNRHPRSRPRPSACAGVRRPDRQTPVGPSCPSHPDQTVGAPAPHQLSWPPARASPGRHAARAWTARRNCLSRIR
eukprot:scaffold15662_cov109-Isochrysis_galbana.AAC.6